MNALHFTYNSEEAPLSFTWSGRPQDPIEVSFDGYGKDTIPVAPAMATFTGSSAQWMCWFKGVCDDYIRVVTQRLREAINESNEE